VVAVWSVFALGQRPKVRGTRRSTCSWHINAYPAITLGNGFIEVGAVVALVLITRNALLGFLYNLLALPGLRTFIATNLFIRLFGGSSWLVMPCYVLLMIRLVIRLSPSFGLFIVSVVGLDLRYLEEGILGTIGFEKP
jgi:hypothetical protein